MLCDICNKNEATIHYTEVINGVKKERNLCSECMQEFDQGMEGDFPFSKIIRGILSAHMGNNARNKDSLEVVACDKCKMTYKEFTKVGKFGCAECYSVFGPLIIDNIKKIQGNNIHTGKKYIYESGNIKADNLAKIQLSVEDEISLKNKELKKALEIEDYETAARIRDEVKLLKERL